MSKGFLAIIIVENSVIFLSTLFCSIVFFVDSTEFLFIIVFYIFQASECKKSALEIAEIAGAAESTIKNTYRLMYPQAFRLFPEDFEFDTPVYRLPTM